MLAFAFSMATFPRFIGTTTVRIPIQHGCLERRLIQELMYLNVYTYICTHFILKSFVGLVGLFFPHKGGKKPYSVRFRRHRKHISSQS